MASGVSKRKAKTSEYSSRKKIKTKHLTANDLAWRTISTSKEAGFSNELEGILELEEVDNVEVTYEETEGGRIARFNVVENSDDTGDESPEETEIFDANIEAIPSGSTLEKSEEAIEANRAEISFDSKILLPDWNPFDLHPRLLRNLYCQKFFHPTPIQVEAIPSALKGKDIVGVAETGSGKTLAYGLPILHSLLESALSIRPRTKGKRSVAALILTPTRELALQVSSHLNACLRDVDIDSSTVKEEENDSSPALLTRNKHKGKDKTNQKKPTLAHSQSKNPPPVSVAAIVGGMSSQKQKRILDRGVDVLVATPGRLWDILQQDDELTSQIKHLRFLVLDEADRMIETGHFAELDNILRLTMRMARDEAIESEEPDAENSDAADKEDTQADAGADLQTFVFSATLSKDLQQNLKKRKRPKKKNKKPPSTLDDLVMKLDFRDPEPTCIDLSPEGDVVSALKESRIDCLQNDKDAYLYFFLLRYPGRSLVFLSSIDGIRRLLPMLELLEVKAWPLHSQLEQRQRLKNLDRFKSTPNSVLLATDIAARGLDIPAVDHVIHYQVPRSADVYVHRNGRTARAMREGFSLLMVAPDERRLVKALMNSLKRNEDEISEIAVELYLLDKLKARIQLARQIDATQHKVQKENHEKNWLREAAKAMDIEIDSDMGISDDEIVPTKHKKRTINVKTAEMKAELKQLLAQPLVAKGVSTRYITSGSRPIVDDVLSGQYHESMLGLVKTQAGHDVVAAKKKLKPQKAKEEFEEWHGIDV